MLVYIQILTSHMRAEIDKLRRDPEAGYATETVLVTALLVVAALAVITIIVAKIIAKANSIDLGT